MSSNSISSYSFLKGIITKNDEVECVCQEIRRAGSKTLGDRDLGSEGLIQVPPTVGLEDFQLGNLVAKGCNAVVYSAKSRTEATSPPIEESGASSDKEEFPLAVKMMFNYDIESNSTLILKAMQR